MNVFDGLKALVELWPLLALLASLVFGGTMLFLHSRFTSRRECEGHRTDFGERQGGLNAQQDEEAKRLAGVEASLKNLPTRGDLSALELAVERLNGHVQRLDAVVSGHRELMKRVENQLDRIDLFMKGLKP